MLDCILKQFRQDNRRNLPPFGCVCIDVHIHLQAVRVADRHERQELIEERQLVGQRHEPLRAGFQQVSIAARQRADKRRRARMALLDEVAERIEVVEQRVRIDLALQREQLRLDVQTLQLIAALAVAFPFLDEEQRFVDVRDER